MTDGKSLVRNSAFNVLGLVVPLLLAVVAIPPLVRGYGADRFGILTLAWAAIGYFNLFELGLSRALTQAVARRLGAGEGEDLASVVWTTLALLFTLGLVAAVVLASTTPVIVDRALRVPNDLRAEARACFYILTPALPLALMSAGMRGLMEAHQDFGVVNAIRLPLAAFTFLGPLSVLPFSHSLVPAIVVLVVGRAAGWIAHTIVCVRRYVYLRGPVVFRAAIVGPLVRYGGWTTVSNVVSPLMVYMDRFVIGAVLSIAAVTSYVTPYEVVTKLMIVPASVLAAVFPAFAAASSRAPDHMGRLYDRSQRMVLLVAFPLLLPCVALAHEGLTLWMGGSSVLPADSALVLQWLAVGIFINAVAQAPFTALQGAGRPDIVAKIHLVELPAYLGVMWWLLHAFGIVGVAMAWTLRVTIDAAAMLYMAHRKLTLDPVGRAARGRAALVMLLLLLAAGMLTNSVARLAYVIIVLAPFGWLAWRHLLKHNERAALLLWLRSSRALQPAEPA